MDCFRFRLNTLCCLAFQNLDGVNYLYIKKSGLYFMCTSKYNVAPSFVLELISCCSKVFKDYCGVMNEESIRKNFVLVYELLEEMIVQNNICISSFHNLYLKVFLGILRMTVIRSGPVQTRSNHSFSTSPSLSPTRRRR